MRETKDPVSDAARQCAVELLSMTAMVISFAVLEPPDPPQDFLLAVAPLAFGVLVGVAVLVIASRAIQHRNPEWHRIFRVGHSEGYEWVAAFVGLGVTLLVVTVLTLVLEPGSSFLPFLAGLYAGNFVRALLIVAGAAATSREQSRGQ
jgi:hypothetical protein